LLQRTFDDLSNPLERDAFPVVTDRITDYGSGSVEQWNVCDHVGHITNPKPRGGETLRKHFHMLAIVAVVLLVPSLIFAASAKFGVAKATSSESLVTVPLVIENEDNLAAIDIPLAFSEGVALREVSFEGTRTEYFDLKIANIKNDENTVVIGLLPQMSSKFKPDLAAGDMNSKPVANLVFEILDPTVTDITISAVVMEDPHHSLQYVYHEYDGAGNISGLRVERPEFESFTFSLSGGDSPSLPGSYALNQNYPNPFNPSTEIAFALPEASRVNLTVFNVLGQKVVTLVDKDLEAGEHTVTFNADQYGSGVYFYRLAASNFTETKKMVLLK
jgi:hypothetical protein